MTKEKEEEGFQLEPSFKEELNVAMARAMMNRDTLEVMREQAKMQVTDEDSARQALSCSLQARKIKNKVEQSRKEIVRPHIDFQKAVMKFTKDVFEGFEQIEKDFQLKVSDWMDTQKENPFTRVDEIKVDDGSINLKTVHSFTVTDEALVPREFLAVDDKKVKDAIAKGQRNIPGVEILTFEVPVLRVKN